MLGCSPRRSFSVATRFARAGSLTMSFREKSHIPFENRILGALPRAEYARLSPHLEQISLPAGRPLCEAGGAVRHAYFLKGGMVSLLSVTEGGGAVEVGMIGNEGVVGLPSVLRVNIMPYRAVVQIQASAVRVPATALRAEFDRGRSASGFAASLYSHAGRATGTVRRLQPLPRHAG